MSKSQIILKGCLPPVMAFRRVCHSSRAVSNLLEGRAVTFFSEHPGLVLCGVSARCVVETSEKYIKNTYLAFSENILVYQAVCFL